MGFWHVVMGIYGGSSVQTTDGPGWAVASQVYHPGTQKAQTYKPGPKAAEVYQPGPQKAEAVQQ